MWSWSTGNHSSVEKSADQDNDEPIKIVLQAFASIPLEEPIIFKYCSGQILTWMSSCRWLAGGSSWQNKGCGWLLSNWQKIQSALDGYYIPLTNMIEKQYCKNFGTALGFKWLRFQAINDGNNLTQMIKRSECQSRHCTLRMTESIKPPHIAVFVHMYSSKASVFLLGIKMRTVMDHRLLTYAQVKAKADCLWSHQEWFLAQMETCLMWDISTLDLVDC